MTHHTRTTREVFDHHVEALNEADLDDSRPHPPAIAFPGP